MRFTKNDLEFLEQAISHELYLFLGEWYMDAGKGLPYRPPQGNKSQHRSILESALRAKIISVKGVKKVVRFLPKYDKKERLFEVEIHVETDAGLLKTVWDSGRGGIT
ncbi:MAG: hypothetical protein LBU82_04935 [Treponema sp.]|nr:hypothetical protein [Treponema sp.]